MIFTPGQELYTIPVCYGLLMIALGILFIVTNSLTLRNVPHSATTTSKALPVPSVTDFGTVKILSIISAVVAGIFLFVGVAFLFISFFVAMFYDNGDERSAECSTGYLVLRAGSVVILLVQCVLFSTSAAKIGSVQPVLSIVLDEFQRP